MSPGQRACEKTIVPITFLLPQQKKQATAMASASPFHALSPLKQASHAHQIQALYAMDPCFSILCSKKSSTQVCNLHHMRQARVLKISLTTLDYTCLCNVAFIM